MSIERDLMKRKMELDSQLQALTEEAISDYARRNAKIARLNLNGARNRIIASLDAITEEQRSYEWKAVCDHLSKASARIQMITDEIELEGNA